MTHTNSQQNRGFSLVELIVIISLFAIMSSVVSFDFQQYQQKIDRVNLATDIALAFRQMQVYGISASNRVVGGDDFETDSGIVETLVNNDLVQDTSLYGVEFDLDRQELILFQEIGGDSTRYDSGTDVLIDQLAVTGENEATRICVAIEGSAKVNGEGICQFEGVGEQIESGVFTALFQRPFPDGSYYFTDQPGIAANSMIIVVGTPENLDPGFNNYIYLDAVGLIQSVGVDAVLAE